MSRNFRIFPLVLGMGAAFQVAGSPAATLRPGDVVLTANTGGSPLRPTVIVVLDAATLDTTLVGSGPLVTYSEGVVVDRGGRILVADWYSGIVHVDPASGSQSVLTSASRLGGNPRGLCLASDGDLFVSVYGPMPGVVRVAEDGSTVSLVTSGDLISYPGGLVLGPDGALYVTESALPTDNGGTLGGVRGHGSIVRVDPTSGGQTRIAADSLFLGPFDIAFVGPGEIWTAQAGHVAGRRGCFVETRLSDGRSVLADATSDCRSGGMAVARDATIYVSDCRVKGPDCYLPYTMRLPGGPTLYGLGGRMAVVPAEVVVTRRASWGALKTIYR